MKPRTTVNIESIRSSLNLDFEKILADIGFNRDISKLILNVFMSNKANQLNCHEFAQLYEQINELDGGDGRNDEVISNRNRVSDLVFRLFDTNHDNNLSIREFMIGMAVSTNGSIKQKVEYAFDFYDLNNKGWLTRSEIKSSLKDIYELADVNQMEEFISGYIDKYAKLMEVEGKISKGKQEQLSVLIRTGTRQL